MEALLLIINAFLAVLVARSVWRMEKQPERYRDLGMLAFKESKSVSKKEA